MGFEAGDEAQIRDVEDFVKNRASEVRLEERLHVIWVCLDMDSDRTGQTAFGSLFEAVTKYANDVPVIVVATKQDKFRHIQFGEAKEELSESIQDPTELNKRSLAQANEKIKARLATIEKEMHAIGRFDACVGVARNDKASIERLSSVTLENVDNEKVRLIYVAAQVANIDIKVNLALLETMKVYQRVLGTTVGLAAIPSAATTNRTAAAISVCREIVKCFGIPRLTADAIHSIVKAIVWDDMSHNLSVALAEGFAVVGLGLTVAWCGMPWFLLSGVASIPLVVPATTRLMLMLASDLILILARAFKQATFRCISTPNKKEIELAAKEHKDTSTKVHQRVMKLVPRRNLVKSFRKGEVGVGLSKIVHEFKEKFMEAGANAGQQRRDSTSSDDASEVDAAMSDMEKDFEMVRRGIEEKNNAVVTSSLSEMDLEESGDEDDHNELKV